MKQIFVLLLLSFCGLQSVKAQTCTQASQATGGNCAGAPGTTATDNQVLTSTAYVKDYQHFNNYTINTGGELVICAGGKLDINNISINSGAIYVHPGGAIVIGNMTTNAAIITNYGTFTTSSTINTSDNDEYYNAGNFLPGGVTMEGSGVLFTNATTGIMNFSGYDLDINSDGFVNEGLVFDVGYFRINSAGMCFGNGGFMVCENFNNNSANSITVDAGGASMVVIDQANNNEDVTNTTNIFEVGFINNCGGPGSDQWGTADTFCDIPVVVPPKPNLFFSAATGSLHDVATWGDQADGTGTSPANFTDDNQVFIIRNRSQADITSNWSVSGNGTVLCVGDRQQAVALDIGSADFDFSGAAVVISAKSHVNVAASRSVSFNTASTLWLVSNEESDGAIGIIDGNIDGLDNNNVVMNKYIPAATGRPWSFLASPMDVGQIDDNWQKQIHVTGPLGTGGVLCSDALATSQATANSSNGLDPNATGNYSMYYLNPAVAPGGSGQWAPVTATNDNTTQFQLNRGNGFRVLVRGPREQGCYLIGTAATGSSPDRQAVSLRMFGSIPDVLGGAGTFTRSYTSSNGNVYIMSGNPFPCTIDFNAFQADISNSSLINDKYWIYSPEKAPGAYSAYAAGVMTNRPSNYPSNGAMDDYIAPWQAFIMEQATSGTTNLSFDQAHKFVGITFQGTYKTTTTPIADLLKVEMTTDAGASLDEVAIRFVNEPSVNNVYYSGYDARSMNDLAVQYLQTIKDTHKLAIQARIPPVARDTVALRVGSYANGIFKFNATGMGSFTNTDVFLLDRLNSTVQHLNSDSDYTFTIDITNTATFGANRFAVIFSKYPNAVIDRDADKYKVYPSPVSNKLSLELPGNTEIYDILMTGMTGNVVYKGTMSGGLNTIDVRSFAAGAYVLKITDTRGGTEVIKVIKY